MFSYDSIAFSLDLIGTIAFAISGALLGIRRSMDLFGILVLGVVTAVGGGMIRDTLLGLTPPRALVSPLFSEVAVVSSLLLFLLFFLRRDLLMSHYLEIFERVLVFFDALGLGAFTVVGMNVAAQAGHGDHGFLLLFMGMITGIGGGIIRDLLAGIVPFVFIRHVYAGASLGGGFVYLLLAHLFGDSTAMLGGFFAVVLLRMFAYHYQWHLPRILFEEPDYVQEAEKEQL